MCSSSRQLNRNKGRGNAKLSLARIEKPGLCSREELVSSAYSASTKANVDRARRVLTEFAAIREASDPKDVDTTHCSSYSTF